MDLPTRIEKLEDAILTLGAQSIAEFEEAGHAFHGNQYTNMTKEELDQHIRGMASELARREAAQPKADPTPVHRATPTDTFQDHLIKGPREAAIVDAAREKGLIPPKGSVPEG